MLTITIQPNELFNEVTQEFINNDSELVLDLEHSLLSLSKWESIYEKPFLASNRKTSAEVLDYIRMMIITPDVPENILLRLSQANVDEVQKYINSKQSATTFGEMPQTKARGETITSELIYYWMAGFQIPFECETWHLNRLFSLIRICNIKQSNQKPRQMSRAAAAAERRTLNAQRRAELNSRG